MFFILKQTGIVSKAGRRSLWRAISSHARLTQDDSRVQLLSDAIRRYGYLQAKINPFQNVKTSFFEGAQEKFTPEDFCLPRNVLVEYLNQTSTVDDWYERMMSIYTGHIGVEYMHLDRKYREWFIEALEKDAVFSKTPTQEFQRQLCRTLVEAQTFDQFVAAKFATVKRYGGEGAESMYAFFHQLFLQASLCGVTDIIIAIPHRGRLNLLTGLLKFPPETVFRKMRGLSEFETDKFSSATGDVLSHLFTSVKIKEDLHVSLLPNPSHLEASCPVAVGKARARLQQLFGNDRYLKVCDDKDFCQSRVLPVQVHGDAAFSGQGVIMETLLLSRLPHFNAGGSLHLIVNNMVGYTTPTAYGKSSSHTSDIMKMIGSPVLHVNGDDPEAVCAATQLAFQFRQKFGADVLLNMLCFRRWGHNEMDDPTFTNPIMYREIHARKSVPDLYSERLQAKGVLTGEEVASFASLHYGRLNEHLKSADLFESRSQCFQGHRWAKMAPAPQESVLRYDTGLPYRTLQYIGLKSTELPEDFKIHPHLKKVVIDERKKRFTEGEKLDWAMCELLAVGSLLYQGFNVRICGQDVGRGTFSHRHAMLYDNDNENTFVPLNSLHHNQGLFEVVNSPLSEEAVMSFEYGYSLESPDNLVIWEAQFGDFNNPAQVTRLTTFFD